MAHTSLAPNMAHIMDAHTKLDLANPLLKAVPEGHLPKALNRGSRGQLLARSLYKPRACAHCGQPYQPIRVDQTFCGTPCKKAHVNLQMVRGREIYSWAYDWRRARGKDKKEAFAAFCRVLDRHIREDREAGRPPQRGYNPKEAWRLPS